jgi:uncharacterized membrane protein YfcA
VLFILLIAAGIIVGIMAGLLGVGGGILFTPIFFSIFNAQGIENPVLWALGTSLFCTFIASTSSSLQQALQGNMYLRQGLFVGILGTIGVFLGGRVALSPIFTREVFLIFFILFLLSVAVLFLRNAFSARKEEDWVIPGTELSFGKSLVTGGAGGFIAALAGVGGGIVMVPLMNVYFKMDMVRTVSISSFAIMVITFSGWIQYALAEPLTAGITSYSYGFVDLGTALPVAMGAVAGGLTGVRLNHRVKGKWIYILFTMMIATAITLLLIG